MYRASQELRFSQNLINALLARRLVEKLDFSCCDIIIEIGAGGGAITAELAKKGKKVLAYEIDPERQKVLKTRFMAFSNLTVLCEDFLKSKPVQGSYCVVSNLPFNITSAIMRKLIWAQKSAFDYACDYAKRSRREVLGYRSRNAVVAASKTDIFWQNCLSAK